MLMIAQSTIFPALKLPDSPLRLPNPILSPTHDSRISASFQWPWFHPKPRLPKNLSYQIFGKELRNILMSPLPGVEEKRRLIKLRSSLLASSYETESNHPLEACHHQNYDSVAKSSNSTSVMEKRKKRRVFFLDVNPLCYKGSSPNLQSFAHWVSLLFSEVSRSDPVIAVVDGERGNEYRRHILPSYKANRRKFSALQRDSKSSVERTHKLVFDVLHDCNVPVVKIEAHEADDVVATLVGQVLSRGYQAVIASPDKDFKQLISEDVQIVLPIQELDRWSFYTLNNYISQYGCDPVSDLSMRCFLGDEVDGVPGIQKFFPGFGRKTVVKLLKKHGSLQDLLNAAAVRTVAKPYAQDALIKYADELRRNYEVLSLKRDVDVQIQEPWLFERDPHNDSVSISKFISLVRKTETFNWRRESCLKG
ncbi:OLC1v1012602C1 [Oldenlandia corymbosa var. corymbosa]|uniref:OLC1v1012602C1 n=1 Tax=Oldenlandia corymbosa var. corymbosa TaxID=529605 RepID=A0AAV1DWH1_OLDCO|nr:OLC1v1012602C1 [Oldenlandia corymbosa var. corymbosa]